MNMVKVIYIEDGFWRRDSALFSGEGSSYDFQRIIDGNNAKDEETYEKFLTVFTDGSLQVAK